MSSRFQLVPRRITLGVRILGYLILAFGLVSWITGWTVVRAWDREWSRWQAIDAQEHCESEVQIEDSGDQKILDRKGCRLSYTVNGTQYTTRARNYKAFTWQPHAQHIFYKKDSPAEISFGWCGTPYVSGQMGVSEGRVEAALGVVILVVIYGLNWFLGRYRAGKEDQAMPLQN
jgi:hypothetical protein